jgi:hypothetical protein
MAACNQCPQIGRPFYNTLVACHLPAGHDGPHTWEGRPSLARQSLDWLLRAMPARELERVDAQPGVRSVVLDIVSGEQSTPWPAGAPGPWVLVDFVGGDRYAIWKATGAMYRVQSDGTVADDPIHEP